MPHTYTLAAIASLLLATNLNASQLIRAWESEAVMDKPESAAWDASSGYIYISNIGGEYLARDGNGYISRLLEDGQSAEVRWLDKGLNNPQGLALVGDKLYVADIDRVVCIDIPSACIDKEFHVKNARFLNDLCASAEGDIYASDCFDNKIYRIHAGELELWLDSPLLDKPNGLLWDKGSLMLLNFGNGQCYRVDGSSKEMTLVCEGIANADGITSDGKGGYYISGAWQGELYHIDEQGTKSLLLDLGKENTIVADILYIPEKELLVIPTLNKTVIGYRKQ